MERVLEDVLMCLEKIRKKKNMFQALVGFDGFVDTLVKPVKATNDRNEMTFFESIEEFGKYLEGKAGKSCSIELYKITEKMGGNAAIYASAISSLGLYTRCVGAFGYPEVKDVFKTGNKNMELITISNPGFCTALEFSDGKVMLAENEGINDINYHTLLERLGKDQLYQLIYKSDMISLMNWSEVPGSTDIWQGLLTDVFEVLPGSVRKKMFIDISDCSRRSGEAIEEMLEQIAAFSDYCDVALSLNENEFEVLCDVCGIPYREAGMEAAGRRLRSRCHIKYLVVHLMHGAYAFSDNGCCFADNRYVCQPLISTGGGDNFNAGLSYGIMAGMDIRSAMALANAASGFYVTHGYSAGLDEIIEYLYTWKNDMASEMFAAAVPDTVY